MDKDLSHSPEEQPVNVDFFYRAEQRILVARTNGVLSASSWPQIISMTIDEGHQYNCCRFLIDHRRATFRFKFADLWALPRNAGAFQRPKDARVALLFTSLSVVRKEFIEAFSRTRGRELRVFKHEALATAWLLEPKPTIFDWGDRRSSEEVMQRRPATPNTVGLNSTQKTRPIMGDPAVEDMKARQPAKVFSYQGYRALYRYVAETQMWEGGIHQGNMFIEFGGYTEQEAEDEFRSLLDAYLKECSENGEKPEPSTEQE
jgi:hypothetical protein